MLQECRSVNPSSRCFPRGRAAALLATALAVTSGCSAARTVNAPLHEYSPTYGYTLGNPELGSDAGAIDLSLMFSGGGTRASALAYGVLLELRDTTIVVDGKPVRLLDEVDVISSVSGGSFTAAYYGLYGDRIFTDFEDALLRRDIDAELAVGFARPLVALRMLLTSYDRSDWAEHVYNEHIFHDATYADLQRAGGPMIRINATDIGMGSPFPFDQDQFSMICSDLSRLSVARAVLASSSVPVAFAPTVLENFAGSCGYQVAPWLEGALADRTASRRRFHIASRMAHYLDSSEHRYVYLLDGGVSDNLGIRGFLNEIIEEGGWRQARERTGQREPKPLAVIVVNAEADRSHAFQKALGLPSIPEVLSAVSGTGMHNYNFETLELLEGSVETIAQQGGATTGHVVEVAFNNLPDPEEREYFNGIETSINLGDEAVDRLIAVGRRLLRESEAYQAFLASVGAASGPSTARGEDRREDDGRRRP